MNKLFEKANEYVRASDWKILSLVKLCLCALGILIGINVRPRDKKAAGIVSAVVFAVTWLLLVPRFFKLLFAKDE